MFFKHICLAFTYNNVRQLKVNRSNYTIEIDYQVFTFT